VTAPGRAEPIAQLTDRLHHLAAYGLALAATIVAAALAGAAVLAVARGLLWRWRTARFGRDARLVEISCPPQADEAGAAALWAHLMGLLHPAWKRAVFGQPHLAFEYVADAAGMHIRLWVPGVIPPGIVERAVCSAWPGATVTTRPADPPAPLACAAAGGRLVLARPDHHPIKSDHAADPMRALLGAVSGLGRGEYAVVQILARPATGRRLSRAHRAAAALRGAPPASPAGRLFGLLTPDAAARRRRAAAHPGEVARLHPERAEQVRAILAKAAQPRYAVAIQYAVATHTRVGAAARGWLRGHAHTLASVYALYAHGPQHLRRRRLYRPLWRLDSRRLTRGQLLSAGELAALAHLPYDADAPGVTRAGARPVAPPPMVPTGPSADESAGAVRVLGDSDTGQARPVALAVADARHHMHMLGETGSGKSTLLAHLILADAHAGRGALVIDPKGDLVTDVLARLPLSAADRTVIFDPADGAPPPCVNVLAGPDPAFAVDSIVTIFHRCFANAWGPRVDDLLRSACLTLTAVHRRRASLGQLPQLLTDSPYRARTVARLDDELLAGFWASYDDLTPAGRATVIGPVMNKLRAFLLRPFVRDALTRPATTVDLGRLLDAGGLVLVRVPKGVLGEDAAKLFGSLLLAHAWQNITRRARTHQAARPDAAVYVDECHNFLNLPGSVSDVLAEARGYRLGMVLAHQHLSQLPKDLRDAVSADARNKIYFAASPEDARDLAHHTYPLLSEHDLAHLGGYQAAARLITDGAHTAAFTFRTRPLPPATAAREETIRAAAREQYAQATRPSAAPSARPAARATDPRQPHPHRTDPRTDPRVNPGTAERRDAA
jgi:hypothetical protein